MANCFISHRTSDLTDAIKLANELKKAGHDVWIDEWEIGFGDSIIARMQEGLEKSTYVLMCCSRVSPQSPWMGREWMSALARQLDGHNIKLLPVMFEGGSPPEIIADIKYAKLGEDWNGELSKLLRAIK